MAVPRFTFAKWPIQTPSESTKKFKIKLAFPRFIWAKRPLWTQSALTNNFLKSQWLVSDIFAQETKNVNCWFLWKILIDQSKRLVVASCAGHDALHFWPWDQKCKIFSDLEFHSIIVLTVFSPLFDCSLGHNGWHCALSRSRSDAGSRIMRYIFDHGIKNVSQRWVHFWPWDWKCKIYSDLEFHSIIVLTVFSPLFDCSLGHNG